MLTLVVQLGVDRLRKLLVPVVGFLIVATFASQLAKAHGPALGSVVRFFDSNVKLNFPSVFKELALLGSCVTIWFIGKIADAEHDPWAKRWKWLAVVVGFLGLDESITAHQSVNDVLTRRYDTSGVLHFSWVIVYLPIAALVVVGLTRFWWNLAPRLRTALAGAGLLFGGGSGLLELAKGAVASSRSESSLAFYLLAALSDSLEMIGLALLLVTMVDELARRVASIELVLLDQPPADPVPAAGRTDVAHG